MKNIKLNTLASQNLDSKEMNVVRGGGKDCCCSCKYVEQGGSTTSDNMYANHQSSLTSPGCAIVATGAE